jgi:three-Cys-motif partner protein
MQNYPAKKAWLYFNDLSTDKIATLKTYLPDNAENFHIITNDGDGNDFLASDKIPRDPKLHYLLVYDPYKATINWNALAPYLNTWGEVILNHMHYDSVRGVSQLKSDEVLTKYENTYLTSIENLVDCDRNEYERRIQEIITSLRQSSKPYYIASFPFFNRKNAVVYNLLHCSSNIHGFKLYKSTVWKVFGGKSSTKNRHGLENQLMLGFDDSEEMRTATDEDCYNINDIVMYIQDRFRGCTDVQLTEIWSVLDEHPIFPSDGFKDKIKIGLKEISGNKISQSTISFAR